MSIVTIGISDEQLKRLDACCAAHGSSREQIAAAGLDAELKRLESKPAKSNESTKAAKAAEKKEA